MTSPWDTASGSGQTERVWSKSLLGVGYMFSCSRESILRAGDDLLTRTCLWLIRGRYGGEK